MQWAPCKLTSVDVPPVLPPRSAACCGAWAGLNRAPAMLLSRTVVANVTIEGFTALAGVTHCAAVACAEDSALVVAGTCAASILSLLLAVQIRGRSMREWCDWHEPCTTHDD